jgi:hypothetical protein
MGFNIVLTLKRKRKEDFLDGIGERRSAQDGTVDWLYYILAIINQPDNRCQEEICFH